MRESNNRGILTATKIVIARAMMMMMIIMAEKLVTRSVYSSRLILMMTGACCRARARSIQNVNLHFVLMTRIKRTVHFLPMCTKEKEAFSRLSYKLYIIPLYTTCPKNIA